MYKLLLCWRYLRTRYIALVCIVSVTLGVATMIVVNSVMAGFTHEMQARLNGMLGDLVLESRSLDGAPDAEAAMAKIRSVVGDVVVGMSPTVTVPSLMYFTINGQLLPQQVTLVGIDQASYSSVSAFGQYLQHPQNREQLRFTLHDGEYDQFDHQADNPSAAAPRAQMKDAGWPYRRQKAAYDKRVKQQQQRIAALREQTYENSFPALNAETQGPAQTSGDASATVIDPFANHESPDQRQGEVFDPAVEQHTGIVVGIGICGFRAADGSEQFIARPGDDVKISFPLAKVPPEIASQNFTIVDFYESKMSEYDTAFVFAPLRAMQEARGMIDPETGVGKFNAIQIKLSPGVEPAVVRDRLRDVFAPQMFAVSTWRDKQGPLLAAVQMETAVLNVLLFLIIAVAGFGILAIFYMIVVEKTRDIGILKSLGASGSGVMGIFLGYGLSLGLVGSGAGMAIGLLFVANINEIADLLGKITGTPVFDPAVYYFYKIPTIVDPLTVGWIVAGAVGIAVLASILPARRAARLHPVRALRYE